MSRHSVVLGLAGLVLALGLASGCATAAKGVAKEESPGVAPAGVTGAIVQFVRGVGTGVTREATFGPTSVAVAAGEWGAHAGQLDRTPSGTWRGGADLVHGYRHPELLDVELTVAGNRITGPSVDVRVSPVPGGIRLDGLWLGSNVDLEVTSTAAIVRGERWPRDASGGYVSPRGPTVLLRGEADRLDSPTMPQMALMLLLFGWGVG